MRKTIQKQVFTENTEKYCRFLHASDVNLKASAASIQAEVETHHRIQDLIQACNVHGKLDQHKMNELIAASCPDFVTMHAFQILGNELDLSSIDSYFATAEQETVLINCAGTSCEVCWKNYINQMAKIINGSAIDIKTYDDTSKGETDGD